MQESRGHRGPTNADTAATWDLPPAYLEFEMTMPVSDALEVVLRHEELNLPEEVFSVLSESGDDDLDQRLIEILEDPEHRIGYAALHAVRLLGARRTVGAAEVVARLVADFTGQNDMINDYGTGALRRMGPMRSSRCSPCWKTWDRTATSRTRWSNGMYAMTGSTRRY
jgi:hypothetical protein